MNACLSIRTFDPNIDDVLLSKLGNIKTSPIKVLKLKNPADIYTTPERMDSPVVSKTSLKSLINALSIAGDTKIVMKSNVFIQTAAFTASVLLAFTLGTLGMLAGINAGHLFALQGFWTVIVLFFMGISK